MTKSRNSFTFIELLIVIIIIWVLASAIIPTVKNIQWRARDKSRVANIYQLQAAMRSYAIDHNGQFPSTTWAACVGAEQWVKCWPWHQQNSIGNGWDWSAWARAYGNSWFNSIVQEYLGIVPLDPSPTRSIGWNYIYRSKWSIDYHCNPIYTVHNRAVIARQPELLGPESDDLCAPWKRACCSAIGCGGRRFCVYELQQ